jgi:hypothetical protein
MCAPPSWIKVCAHFFLRDAELFYLSLDGRLLIEPELLRRKFNRGEFTINNSSHKRPD